MGKTRERKIERCGYSVAAVPVGAELGDDPQPWLGEQAGKHGLATLLAHADDGVIWGMYEDNHLALSGEVFGDKKNPPTVAVKLRKTTLRQARLFGPHAELLLWRDGEGRWQARLLRDEELRVGQWCFDEAQILWGDDREGEPKQGFTLVTDGQQGLRHAVPLVGIHFPGSGVRPLRLGVRHYLEADDDGVLTIVHSRLSGVWIDSEKEESND